MSLLDQLLLLIRADLGETCIICLSITSGCGIGRLTRIAAIPLTVDIVDHMNGVCHLTFEFNFQCHCLAFLYLLLLKHVLADLEFGLRRIELIEETTDGPTHVRPHSIYEAGIYLFLLLECHELSSILRQGLLLFLLRTVHFESDTTDCCSFFFIIQGGVLTLWRPHRGSFDLFGVVRVGPHRANVCQNWLFSKLVHSFDDVR